MFFGVFKPEIAAQQKKPRPVVWHTDFGPGNRYTVNMGSTRLPSWQAVLVGPGKGCDTRYEKQ